MDKTPKTDRKLTPQILAMYLGCRAQNDGGKSGIIVGVYESVDFMGQIQVLLRMDDGGACRYGIQQVKPILRRLEDMTEEEAIIGECYDQWMDLQSSGVTVDWTMKPHRPGKLLWLLSKSFDLFGLIDNNEAIDQKSLA